jgi:hypothetical protein
MFRYSLSAFNPFYFLSITFEFSATIASICCCLRFSQITKYLKTSLLMLAFLVLTSGHFYAQEPTPKPINEKVVIKIPNADPLYQKIRRLSNAADAFSGEFATVNNLVLKKDSAVFTLRSGEVYFLKPAQERTVGAVFFGDGEFSLSPQVDVEKNI